MKTGETDFLRLPEQPDPSAWASIASELSGEQPASTSTEAEAETPTTEAPPVETEAVSAEETEAESSAEESAEPEAEVGEEPLAATAATAETVTEAPEQSPVSPSAERANELLDELRVLIVGLSQSAPAPDSVGAFNDVKPTAEEISRFAVLRAAVDTASERPRDIDTMLDLSARLDDIKALHDAFTRLAEAVSAGESTNGEQPDQ